MVDGTGREGSGRIPHRWGDRLLIVAGTGAALLLAAALWSVAGAEVFTAALSGLWALCF